MGNIRCNQLLEVLKNEIVFFQDYPLEYYTTTVAHIEEEDLDPEGDYWDSEDYLVDVEDEHNNVSTTTSNVEQTESFTAKETEQEGGEDEQLQDPPLPTLLTDSDFSNNPFLEETAEAMSEEEEGGEKGNEEERTTRKSFLLQGIRVTVREGGGRRWKQGSHTNLLESDLKMKPVEVAYEFENNAETNVEEGENKNFEVKNVETTDNEDPSLINDNSSNNLIDLISTWPGSSEEIEENEESEVFEEEAVGIKLNMSRSGGTEGEVDSDKGQAESGATLLPSLMDRQPVGREERGDNGQRDSVVEGGPKLEHFLRIGATMQEGLSLLAEERSTDSDSFLDSKVLERNIVRTDYSPASEKIHPLLNLILCLQVALITF